MYDGEVITSLIDALRRESSEFDVVNSLEELKRYLSHRLQQWSRFVNNDPSEPEPPSTLLPLGRPLFALAGSLRRLDAFGEPFRLFVMLDQYESLHTWRHIIDYRPMFNEAMYAAARGGTGVEFKIGTRQYSYTNFLLPEGRGRIELDREVIEINLDSVSKHFYRQFAVELFQRRMRTTARSGTEVRPRARLPRLKAVDETRLYVGDSPAGEAKYISLFIQRWHSYGLTQKECEQVATASGLRAANPLVGVLACIAITRWCRDRTAEPPLRCAPGPKEAGRSAQMAQYLKQLLQTNEGLIKGAISRKSGSHERAVADFVHDTESAALFQLASYYKNKRKYYCGFDTIVRLSSNVAIVLIEILRSAYERLLLSGADTDAVVPVDIQSDAIYRTAANWFGRIAREYDFGQTHQDILNALGGLLRRAQLELTARWPCPNGFSVEQRELEIPGEETQEQDPRNDSRSWLREAVSWGLLEEEEHKDKTRGNPPRMKYYLNRIYCPYFGISEVWRKDPIYVRNLDNFVRALADAKTPSEFHTLLNNLGQHRDARQGSLPIA